MKEELALSHIDYVIPVPLHKKKLRKRGYSQVAKFGQRLADPIEAEYSARVRFKTANTRTQTKMGRLSRWQHDKSLFELNDLELLKNKHVLLFDDIITTAATIESCAMALKKTEGITLYVARIAVVP